MLLTLNELNFNLIIFNSAFYSKKIEIRTYKYAFFRVLKIKLTFK